MQVPVKKPEEAEALSILRWALLVKKYLNRFSLPDYDNWR
jgi:hypothetical protein